MSEAQLFDPGPPDLKLTPRQLAAFEFICSHPEGVHADELGSYLHEWADYHAEGARCDWCAKAGKEVAEALVAKQRIHRGRGIYRPLRANRHTADDSYDPATSPWPEGF